MRGYTRRRFFFPKDKLSHWPWLAMACPGLTEIEEDVFESFKDDEREVPGVIRHRFKR